MTMFGIYKKSCSNYSILQKVVFGHKNMHFVDYFVASRNEVKHRLNICSGL